MIRGRICEGLGWAGLKLDQGRNEQMVARGEGQISTDDSTLNAWVIPTDEELLIARDTVRCILASRIRIDRGAGCQAAESPVMATFLRNAEHRTQRNVEMTLDTAGQTPATPSGQNGHFHPLISGLSTPCS